MSAPVCFNVLALLMLTEGFHLVENIIRVYVDYYALNESLS